MNLINKHLKVYNIGLKQFSHDLTLQNTPVVQADWKPPKFYKPEILAALKHLQAPERLAKIQAANQTVVNRIIEGHPYLVAFKKAKDVIPALNGQKLILHAGPPVSWDKMCGALQGGISAAIVFEGWADNVEQAYQLAASGQIKFAPCHEHSAVGAMGGIMSPNMYVHVVENKPFGTKAFITLSEQSPKNIRFGANGPEVIERLFWMRDVFGPMLASAMELHPTGIDLRVLMGNMLHMGDEAHNRNNAGSLLLTQALAPYIALTNFSDADKAKAFQFIAQHQYFSGPLWMAACKSILDAAHGVENSTIVTTMCRNGYEFGIRVSHFPGYNWFTGPAQKVIGNLTPGYTEADQGLDIGDSAITETYGIGGFAFIAAPAIIGYIGGTVSKAMDYTLAMEQITTAFNPNITIPILNFRGIATGIDVLKVVSTSTLPLIDTAIAHKEAGIGFIGAGIVFPPTECFEKAILALAASIA